MKDKYITPDCEVQVIMHENTILESSNEPVEEKTFPW